MTNNSISASLALIKAGIRTNQKSRRLAGWRKWVYNSVRYGIGFGLLYLMIKLMIYLAF
jgi:hypothetical protein